jgi:hypothetical protein
MFFFLNRNYAQSLTWILSYFLLSINAFYLAVCDEGRGPVLLYLKFKASKAWCCCTKFLRITNGASLDQPMQSSLLEFWVSKPQKSNQTLSSWEGRMSAVTKSVPSSSSILLFTNSPGGEHKVPFARKDRAARRDGSKVPLLALILTFTGRRPSGLCSGGLHVRGICEIQETKLVR